MLKMMKKLWKNEKGLETVEYAIMAGLIVIAAIVAITAVGGQVAVKFNSLLTALGGGGA